MPKKCQTHGNFSHQKYQKRQMFIEFHHVFTRNLGGEFLQKTSNTPDSPGLWHPPE
jgi:hypothetical protein